MPKKIVISQPMFFPWVGLFEQVKLADVFVHYDDVQFPQGRSFLSRVQIKTHSGVKWLTVPVRHSGRLINEVILDDTQNWREKHLKTLQQNYAKAPFVGEMLDIVRTVYKVSTPRLSELNCLATETVAEYFDLCPMFVKSSDYGMDAASSERLLQLMQALRGTIYITGHGALHYLNHELFERNGIRVEYIDYQKVPYKQLHGAFTPFVTILDLIANVGKEGVNLLTSETVYWKDFIN